MVTQNFGYKKLYIDGTLVDSENKKRAAVICPATGETIAEVAQAGKQDAEKALITAQKGFKYWSKLTLAERTEWMQKLRTAILAKEHELKTAMVHEMGKTYGGAAEDIEALVNALDWYPNAMKNLREEQIPDYENTHTHKMVSKPAGVAVAYLAWNFPLLNVGFKLGPALAAGCSIIIKPSALSPLSTYMIGEILHEINFPAGVINILSGPSKEVATTLTTSTIPAVLTMIGSTATGQKVIADSTTSIKKLGMELGGNAPFIVFEDADFEKALNLAIGLKYSNSGQICVAANRIMVHKNIYDKFLKAYIKKASELTLGFGTKENPDVFMGPVVARADRDRMFDLVKDAVSKGATLEYGGKIPEGLPEKGNWIEPTVVSGITPEMDLFRKETFGPVAGIMSFDSDDEVLALANDTDFGLASYIFTNNHKRIERFTDELEFGEIQINGVKYSIYLPHGGIKNSGIGHDCSHLALDDYLVKKRVSTALF
ncbi:succinate-semialdehyde dehydrogenase/glutarate-semialdehyde dehydrogenase [Wenyingzhuangia heitensis]|uniref:Succinate-semialdehyde dehydrogenase/glutarate-semialdehyde dehydrogenase n=1 Tax=Wenyingzhuangia heitensis TaxID=1487859 RepID=A0ABX0UB41_9FLAO|nr:aldehyde dehydrogenase family protein [Wenyingzhuangia heitensis]NIJ46039.1 succinate-semialdehyde dehydrogenase/glutarate-semialdehyde dehydrogenase [Wenyingzhuangia heitensis]